MVNLVGQKVVDANKFIQGKSVQWVIDWTARKMGQATGNGRLAKQHPGQPASGTPNRVMRIVGGDREQINRLIDSIPNPVRREAVRRAYDSRRSAIAAGGLLAFFS